MPEAEAGTGQDVVRRARNKGDLDSGSSKARKIKRIVDVVNNPCFVQLEYRFKGSMYGVISFAGMLNAAEKNNTFPLLSLEE